MTTLLESRARPFGSKKGMIFSMTLHGLLLVAIVIGTTRVVLPPREKIEAHPILYVVTPPPPAPVHVAPPLPRVKTPPKPKAAAPRRVAVQPPRAALPKAPATPALVAPVSVPVSVPSIDLKAAPTIGDIVAPAVAEPSRSGVSAGGTVSSTSNGDVSSGGLGSGGSGKAYDENQVERIVSLTRSVTPRYPESLRSVGVQGQVTMRYIVSAEGKVEPGSIEVISAPHKLFGDAVRTALLNMRFRPAEAGGRSVRQLVEQTFDFRLSKTDG